jgi:tetratricopeptide (TPR) repeat protein
MARETPNSVDDTLAVGPSSLDETLAGLNSPKPSESSPLAAGDTVGRFIVLSKLGAGGMGVVYAAYDPELDRKVALKMLLGQPVSQGTRGTEGRSRLLREAQALAKFSHPEIIAIHDVGEHRSSVYLAMEFVEGHTLNAWAKQAPRRWQDLLKVMLAAGRGVAAAHAAGLVHRDLKPDNIMVGDDGRVRVMDFGLTRPQGDIGVGPEEREASPHGGRRPSTGGFPGREDNLELLATPITECGSLVGTPSHMAPEQFAGEEVGAASDQFAFCVTLWELLFGERPFEGRSVMEVAANVLKGRVRPPSKGRRVPGWLRRALERGLRRDPQQRWPSMAALLHELERGQSRVRVRAAIVIGVVLIAAIAGVIGYTRWQARSLVAACEADGAAIDTLWNDEVRSLVREGLAATKLDYVEAGAEQVLARIDSFTSSWKQHRTAACMNTQIEHRLDAAKLDRATWCLDDRRLELEFLVDELQQGDPALAQKAVQVTGALADPSTCVDEVVLANQPQPPLDSSRDGLIEVRAKLARVGTLRSAGKYDDALALVRVARADAEALAWMPLVAAARQREGALQTKTGDYPAAEAASIDAYEQAVRTSAWDVAADAANELIFVVGYLQARPDAGEVWIRNAELANGFAGDPLRLREGRRLGNAAALHFVAGRLTEARELWQQTLAIQESVLGSEHESVAGTLSNLGAASEQLGERDAAKALFERSLAIYEKVLGPEHPEVALSLSNLGVTASNLGDHERAKQLHQRALQIRERALAADHPLLATNMHNLAVVERQLGSLDSAKQLEQRALEILERRLGSDHIELGNPMTTLAGIELEQGRPQEALGLLERAVAIFDDIEGDQSAELEARFLLAQALVATDGDKKRALAEAEKARDGLARAEKKDDVAEVEAWLTANR